MSGAPGVLVPFEEWQRAFADDAVRERVRHAALTGTTMIVSGPEALTLLRLIQREPGRSCDDCGAIGEDLITKGDHHGGQKTVCRDRDACHRRSPG